MGSNLVKMPEEGVCPNKVNKLRKKWNFQNKTDLLNFNSDHFSIDDRSGSRARINLSFNPDRSIMEAKLQISPGPSDNRRQRFNIKWRFRLAAIKERRHNDNLRRVEICRETGYSVMEDLLVEPATLVHPQRINVGAGNFPGCTFTFAIEIDTACCQSAFKGPKSYELAQEAFEVVVVSDSWKALPHLTCLDRIRKNGQMSDVALVCGGRIFPCHRVVLAAASEVFLAMLSNYNFAGATENVVAIEDTDCETLEALIDYIYTGSCPKLAELAPTLLEAADKYLMPQLKFICENAMLKEIDLDNVDWMLELAYLHNAERLKEKAISVAVEGMSKLAREERWKCLGRKHPALLQEVLDVTCSKK